MVVGEADAAVGKHDSILVGLDWAVRRRRLLPPKAVEFTPICASPPPMARRFAAPFVRLAVGDALPIGRVAEFRRGSAVAGNNLSIFTELES